MTTEALLNVYGVPFEPFPLIESWSEDSVQGLWNNLYHQGTVNTASYAAVGAIVRLMQQSKMSDWNAYALVASIEEARLQGGGPPLPLALAADYDGAWRTVLSLALRDLSTVDDDNAVRCALAVVALAKGQRTLATIALCTEDERVEMLGE